MVCFTKPAESAEDVSSTEAPRTGCYFVKHKLLQRSTVLYMLSSCPCLFYDFAEHMQYLVTVYHTCFTMLFYALSCIHRVFLHSTVTSYSCNVPLTAAP